MEHLSNDVIEAAQLADWRKLAQELHARFSGDEQAILAFAREAGRPVAGAEDSRLRMSIDASVIDLRLGTVRDGRWVTSVDLERARAISALAHERGLRPDPSSVTQLEVGLDCVDQDRVAPFWAALLTGEAENVVHDSIIDRWDRVPVAWFQHTEPHELPHQRWHFDLWLAPEEAPSRIAVAIAAGGTVVDDTGAPSFTVLADAAGNRVCVCTSLGR